VTDPSDDFNVMTARHLPRPLVQVIQSATTLPGGDTLVIFALSRSTANGIVMDQHDLIVTDRQTEISGHLIVVRLCP
jgi:uncharacterized protein